MSEPIFAYGKTVAPNYVARSRALYSAEIHALVIELSLHAKNARQYVESPVCEREVLLRIHDPNHALRTAVELTQEWERAAVSLIEPYEQRERARERVNRRDEGAKESLEIAQAAFEAACAALEDK